MFQTKFKKWQALSQSGAEAPFSDRQVAKRAPTEADAYAADALQSRLQGAFSYIAAGEASILHKPSGLWANFSFTASEDRDSDTINAGIFDRKSPPDMFSWDISGGIQKEWWDLGATTLWGGYTNSQDGIGGLTNPFNNPGRKSTANRIPGIGFDTEITGSEVRSGISPLTRQWIPQR